MKGSLGQVLTFRALATSDFPTLQRWISAPHVQRWWRRGSSLADIESRYRPRMEATAPTRVFIVELAGKPIGMIQSYRHADYPRWDQEIGIPSAAGIDYLIGDPDQCGRGVGTAMLKAFAAQTLQRYPGVTAVVAVPQAANRASCRALEKAGFSLVDTRELETGDPSEAGPGAIYVATSDQLGEPELDFALG